MKIENDKKTSFKREKLLYWKKREFKREIEKNVEKRVQKYMQSKEKRFWIWIHIEKTIVKTLKKIQCNLLNIDMLREKSERTKKKSRKIPI